MSWTATQQILLARAQALLQPQLVLGAVAAKPVVALNGSVATVAVAGNVSAVPYVPGSDMSLNSLGTTSIDIDLDQLKAFNFIVDDVHGAQTNPATLADVIDKALMKGTYAIAEVVDETIAALYEHAEELDAGTGLSATTILTYIAGVRSTLRQAGALMPGSWLVLPDVLEPALLNAMTVLPNPSANAVISNGLVTTIFGLDIYISTKLSLGATPADYAFAGCPDAISYVGQIAKLERARTEKQFGDLYKALFTYGVEITNPDGFFAGTVALAT